VTDPSRPADPAARARGRPATSTPHDDAETVRGRERENESAQVLARFGYDIEQNPKLPGDKRPDYLIEGRVFDHMAPETPRARNIWGRAGQKVKEGQASRIVINLDDSRVRVDELREQFRWPIPGLEEVLVIRRGDVRRLFPDIERRSERG
jgi:hypothetical protein